MDYNEIFKFDNTNAEAEESEWAKELKDRKDKTTTPKNTAPANALEYLNPDEETAEYVDKCYFAKLNDKQ